MAGAVRTLLRKAEAFDRLTRGIKVRADAGKTISIVTLANDKVLRGVVTKNEDGSVTIPQELVERWERQTATPYAELSGPEQDSDRKEADKFINLLGIEPKD